MHARLPFMLVAATAVMLVSTIGVRTVQRGAGAAPPAKPLIPVAAGSIALNPDAHWGDDVSMIGTVEAILSKTVFTVDQGKAAAGGKQVLVIAPYLSAPVSPSTYLTVVGEVFKFDPVEVAKRARDNYVLDLAPDVAARYLGRPAVFATSVITPDLVDIGKRVPPPLTAAEQALRDAMVEINTQNSALRGGLDAPDASKVKEQIAGLTHGFTEAQGFFKARNAADAVGWAGDALTFVHAMDTATAAAKWDDLRTAATGLNGLCTTCHTPHRERQDDGSFRFK